MHVLSESLDAKAVKLPWYYKLMQVWWALMLTVTLLNTMLLSWIVHKLPNLSRTRKQQVTCQICHYLFLGALYATPWIRWEFVGPMDWKQVFQHESGHGTFLMLNHTSFLDGIWASAFLPSFGISKTRTLMKSSLFKIPVFGQISRMAGHFGVHFTSTQANNFSVDRDAQAKVNQGVLEHIQAGGSIGLFPEGQVNGEPRRLQTYRRGAFNYVKDHGLSVWSLLATGAHDSWPKSSPLGGFPTNMKVTLFQVFTEAEVEKLSVAELCHEAQVRMQAQLDALYDDGLIVKVGEAAAAAAPTSARSEQKDEAEGARQRKVRAM